MIIDTHAHLDFPEFADDLDDVVRRAVEAGVTRIVTIGTEIDGSGEAIALAERYEQVYAVVGIHPNCAIEAPEDAITKLRQLARHPKVVAIGETGLDYFRLPEGEAGVDQDGNSAEAIKTAQARLFKVQLDLAVELGLNIVIHQRGECREETLAIMEPYHGKLRAVFHCFGGTIAEAQELIALGHLVSFTGIVTFKNAAIVQETAARVPAGYYMVETDCPFLAPVPNRGKRCEPAFTRETALKIAELRGQTLEEVAAETSRTAEGFYRFGGA